MSYECVQVQNLVVVLWGSTMTSDDIDSVLRIIRAIAKDEPRRLVYIGRYPRAMAALTPDVRDTLFKRFGELLTHCERVYLVHEHTRVLKDLQHAYLNLVLKAGHALGMVDVSRVEHADTIREVLDKEARNLPATPDRLARALQDADDRLHP